MSGIASDRESEDAETERVVRVIGRIKWVRYRQRVWVHRCGDDIGSCAHRRYHAARDLFTQLWGILCG